MCTRACAREREREKERERERERGASVREHGALPFGWFCATALTIAPAFLRNCRLAIGIIVIIIISIVNAGDPWRQGNAKQLGNRENRVKQTT
jgi:hypothetical protein